MNIQHPVAFFKYFKVKRCGAGPDPEPDWKLNILEFERSGFFA